MPGQVSPAGPTRTFAGAVNILLICPRVPFPPHDGGAIAMHDVAVGLARVGHRVTVFAVNTPKHHQADTTVLGPDVRLITVDVDTRVTPWGAAKALLARELPYNIARFVSPAGRARLAALLRAERFDLIQFEGTLASGYVADVRTHAPGTPVVLRPHNLECQIWERLARGEPRLLKRIYLHHLARGLRRYETRIAGAFDAIAAITEPDRQQWAALAGPAVQTVAVPAGVDRARFAPQPIASPPPRSVAILGSLNWLPNLEGIRWLLTDVWPQVRARLPDLTLYIAGSFAPAWLTELRAPGVVVVGFVPSAADFLAEHPVLLVPLFSGGGMRIKIIEAMTLGRCVLTTTVGGEGIEADAGREWLVADTPTEWVDALASIFGTPPAVDLAAIGQAAAALAVRRYDNDAVIRAFEALYAQLGVEVKPAATPTPPQPQAHPRS